MTWLNNIARSKEARTAREAPILLTLICFFVAVLLLTNIIVTKHCSVGQFVFTAGAITYPFTFSLLDIISETYGASKAKLAVWMGLVASLLMVVVLQLMLQLPSCTQLPIDNVTFHCLFGPMPGVVLGSMVAYLTAQFIDIYLFAWARWLTNDRYLWFRNNISTLVSQFVDTLLFALIAWIVWPLVTWDGAVMPISWVAWWQITVNEYAFKVVFSILNTPLVYGGVYVVRYWQKRC